MNTIAAATEPDPELTQIRELAAAGATSLAISLLESHQPVYGQSPERWMTWLRLRARLLENQGDWQKLTECLQELPTGVPPDFQDWADSTRARALLEAGDPDAARKLIAELLWQGRGSATAHQVWRELVIQSYLAERQPENASAAMQLFRQDYGDGDLPQAKLRARVALEQQHPEDAVRELAPYVEAQDAQPLLLLARLRDGAQARQVLGRAEALFPKISDLSVRRQLLALIAEAAGSAGDYAHQALTLEQLLTDAGAKPDALFAFDADELWDAYVSYARWVGNQAQLLVGDDPAWFKLATTQNKRYPIRSRSILALLALETNDAELRARAHQMLAEEILAQPDGSELLARLYLHSKRFSGPDALPTAIRYPLIDRAIMRGDLQQAAQLQKGLSAPPAGSEQALWELRRAKVFVLAGAYAEGEAVLDQLVAHAEQLPPDIRDRLVQVVFDLQAVGEHKAAIQVLQPLFEKSTDPQVRRELLYWMADSQRALERPTQAAELYLQSATLPGPQTMDPWAQTARYQAAKSLAKAGLLRDAKTLYEQLIAVTEDPQRQAVLRREMDRLVLLQNRRPESSQP